MCLTDLAGKLKNRMRLLASASLINFFVVRFRVNMQ